MYPRRTLSTLAALTFVGILAAPAASAPPVPTVTGSYFGSFTSNTGNNLVSDLNITLQSKKMLSGSFSMGGVYQSVVFSGKMTPNGRFTISGFRATGAGRLRFQLKGMCNPGGGGDSATLQGTYSITGPQRERGTFFLSGRSNLP